MFQCTANLTAAVPFPSLSLSPRDVELDNFCITPRLAVSKLRLFGLKCTSICTRGIFACTCGILTEYHCNRLDCWCTVCITSYGLKQTTAYNPKCAFFITINNTDSGFKWKEALNCVDWETTNQHDVQSQKTGILATLL
jgi:hypothetical protein